MLRRSGLLCATLLTTACGSSSSHAPSDTDGGTDAGANHDTAPETQPEATPCAPKTCEEREASCGVVDDGCGKLISCGSCPAPDTCGGAGVENQCGCTPRTCEDVGANCGSLDDGCGGTLECGSCSDPDTCGGGHTPNVCGHPVCDDGWCFHYPYPHADDLSGAFAGEDLQMLLGPRGLALSRSGGGWSLLPSFTRVPSDLYDFVSTGAGDGWAVGENGAVLHFDGSILFCNRPDDTYWSPVKSDLHAVTLDAADVPWIVGDGSILRFQSGAWIVDDTFDGVLHDVALAPDGSLWAVGVRETSGTSTPLVRRFDGASWTEEALTSIEGALHGLAVAESGVVTAVGAAWDRGLVLRHEGDGWTEVVVEKAPSAALRSAALHDDELWAVGDQGAIVVVRDGEGRGMPPILGDGSLRLAASDTSLLLVGQQGLVARLHHGFWEPSATQLPPLDTTPVPAWPRRDHDVWTGGDGWVLRWTGLRWTAAPVPMSVAGFYGTSHQDVWIAGNRFGEAEGVVMRYDGERLAEAYVAPGVVFEAIVGTSSTDVRVRDASGVWHHFDGTGWVERGEEDFPVPGGSAIQADAGWTIDEERGFVREKDDYATRVWPFDGLQGTPHAAWAVSPTEVWAVGSDGVVHGNGDEWTKELTGIEVRDVHGRAPDQVWLVGEASGDRGPVWKWDGTALVSLDEPPAETSLHAVSVAEDGTVWCAGEKVHSREASGWQAHTVPGQGPVRALWAWSDQDVWAARGTSLLHYDGSTWEAIDPYEKLDRPPMTGATEVQVKRIFGLTPQEMFFMGHTPERDAAILLARSGDAWGNGVLQSLGGEATFSSVWARDLQNAWVTMGQIGWVYHYRHEVRMFDTVQGVSTRPLQALAGFEDRRWAFGERGAIVGKH